MQLFSKTGHRANIWASQSLAQTIDINLPSTSSTLAKQDDITRIDSNTLGYESVLVIANSGELISSLQYRLATQLLQKANAMSSNQYLLPLFVALSDNGILNVQPQFIFNSGTSITIQAEQSFCNGSNTQMHILKISSIEASNNFRAHINFKGTNNTFDYYNKTNETAPSGLQMRIYYRICSY